MTSTEIHQRELSQIFWLLRLQLAGDFMMQLFQSRFRGLSVAEFQGLPFSKRDPRKHRDRTHDPRKDQFGQKDMPAYEQFMALAG